MPSAELIFLFGESVPKCTHRVDKHFDGYYTIQYMAAGKVDLKIGNQEQPMEGRWFWSAYPGPRIQFQAATGFASWIHRYLAFKGPLVWRWERDGLFPIQPKPAPGNKDFSARFDDLISLSRQTDRRSHLRAVHRLEGLLLDLADAPLPNAGPPAWLDGAIRQVATWAREGGEDEHGHTSRYAALAERLGTSLSTLQRRFVEATGSSPHDYFLQCRVALAREMLGGTGLPVKTIAARLGYRDVYFFSRQFRQLVGVPPAAYRRTRQA